MPSIVTNVTTCNGTQKKEGYKIIDYYNIPDRKKEILEITWHYLLKNGLGHSSVGKLCRETGLAQSSLYHWFDNKDDIWISAGKYGLEKVVTALSAFTFEHTKNIREFFDTLLDEAEKYKYELRLGIQMTTSPVFGERMRSTATDFSGMYERYANELTGIFGCTYEQAEVFIYSIIADIIDYAIWDDRNKTQLLLDSLYERVTELIDIGEQEDRENL